MHTVDGGPLSQSECWALLASESVGRLGLSILALPAILPVQYCVSDGDIYACLGNHDVPAGSVTDSVVAFEVGAFDLTLSYAWSVQIVGTAGPAGRRGITATCDRLPPSDVVRITPAMVTGEHLHLCPPLSPPR
jgi:uncharacterized protein